jgi:hypothetical protein
MPRSVRKFDFISPPIRLLSQLGTRVMNQPDSRQNNQYQFRSRTLLSFCWRSKHCLGDYYRHQKRPARTRPTYIAL